MIRDCGYLHNSFEMISLYLDIIRIVDLLDVKDREILLRRFLQEESPSEIAREYHCSIANITQRTDKAISRFVRLYQKHYHVALQE